MAIQVGIPQAAMVSLIDMVDNCAEIKPGMEVLILAHKDGLYGGVNLVDEEAVAWTASVIQSRGARTSVLWIDDPQPVHQWRLPPIVKGAITGADVLINFSSDLTNEELSEFRQHMHDAKTWAIRMFPLTAALLMTEWAQTPYELVSTIRRVSSKPFMKDMSPFIMTDPNGTYLEGYTILPIKREGIPGVAYGKPRKETGRYVPWPEWLHTQIRCKDINGVFNFNCMLSWWANHIGIAPEWEKNISIEVKNGLMVKISGGAEADALKRFLESLVSKVGDDIWIFDTFHFGVHPNAKVSDYQCPHTLHRRLINHSHSSNLHVHLGSAGANENYPFWPHITGDIRKPTLTVGNKLVYDAGYLCCMEDPEVLAVAAKYPDRPGLPIRDSK